MPAVRKRLLRWLAIPAGLFVLLLVLIDVFDRQLIARPLAAMVEERTGRRLDIRDFDLRWLRPFGLQAGGIQLANAPWASERPMLEVEGLTVALQPLRLFEGPPYAQVRIQAPRLQLEISPEGEGNWQFGQPEPAPAEPGRPSLPVAVELSAGEFLYLDDSVELSYGVVLETLSAMPREEEGGQIVDLHLLAFRNATRLEIDANVALLPEALRGRLELSLDESDAVGELEADLGASPRRVRLQLDSDLLVPAQIAALIPDPQEDEDQTPNEYLPLPRWENLDLQADIRLAAIRLEGMTLHDIVASLRAQERFASATFSGGLADASLSGNVELDTAAAMPTLAGQLELAETGFATLPEQFGLRALPGQIAGALRLGLELPDGELPLLPETILAHLALSEAFLHYTREEAELRLDAAVPPYGGVPELSLRLTSPDATPVDARLDAPPLREIGQGDYTLALAVETEGAQALLSARLDDIFPDEGGFELRLEASGEHVPAFPAFGFIPPDVPEFSLQGTLRREGELWWLREADIAYGPSRLVADASLALAGERPAVTLDARAPLIDLRSLRAEVEEVEAAGGELPELPEPIQEEVEEETQSLQRALNAVDLALTLEAERVQVNDTLALEAARIEGRLEQGNLRLEPLMLGIAEGSVNGSLVLEARQLPVHGSLALDFEGLRPTAFAQGLARLEEVWGPLSGHVELPFSELPTGEGSEDLVLPNLGRVSVNGAELRLVSAPSDSDLLLRLHTPGVEVPEDGQRLRVEGAGRLRGTELSLLVEGGGLQALRDPDAAYPFLARLEAAGAQLSLDGEARALAEPPSLNVSVAAQGEGGEALQGLLAPWLAVPPPAFRLAGELSYGGQGVVLQGLEAELGESDLSGDVELLLAPQEGPPSLVADLRSSHVAVGELRELLGAGAEEPPAESADETDVVAPVPEGARLLPDQDFDLALLQRMEVDVHVTADAISLGERELGAVTLALQGQDGRLNLEPLSWATPDGEALLRAELRVSDPLLAGVVELNLRHLDLGGMLGDVNVAGNAPGMIGGEGKFWLRGSSPASLLGSLDGGMLLIMSGGRLNPLLVEASGLDVGETAVVALSGDQGSVPIDCAFISLHAQAGQVDIDNFVLDSTDTTFYLDGSVNLANEEMDLTFFPESKDASLPASDSPIAIGGSFAQPQINLLTGELAARGLSALALGTLAGPVAALLPFVEAGEGEEATVCESWDQRIQEDVG